MAKWASALSCRRLRAAVFAVSLLAVASGGLAGQDEKREVKPGSGRPAFAEADAVRVLDQLRRGLESNDSSRFLQTFDAKRMPGYAAFRDQVAEFFGRYDAFVVRYHLTQIAMDGGFGAVLADFEFDATAPRWSVPECAATRCNCGWFAGGMAKQLEDCRPVAAGVGGVGNAGVG